MLECLSIESLDLSNNKLEDPDVLDSVISKLVNVKVLVISGNKLVNKVSDFRKKMILKMGNIKFLNNYPVYPADRKCAEAWQRGGVAEERREYDRYLKEKEDKFNENREQN